MVGLFVCCRHCHPETDALRRCCHCAYHTEWLVDRPLCARDLGCVKIAIVDLVVGQIRSSRHALLNTNVIATEYIGNEDTVELGFF
jgi:hypothetical protein